MSWRTQVFPNHDAWAAAGRPIGGVFPCTPEMRDDTYNGVHGWPERYRGAVAYYVALPSGQTWCPWRKAFDETRGYHGEGWEVSGPPDRLTATPSINTKGYHGYLTDGVITDDIEGRTYPTKPMETNEQQTDEQQQAAFARSARIEALIADGKTQDEALAIVDQGAPEPAPAETPAPAIDLEEPPRDDEELEPERVDTVTVKVRAIAPGYDGLRFREKGDVFPLTLVRGRTAPSWVELVEG